MDKRLEDYLNDTYGRIGSLEQGTGAYDEVFVPTRDRSDPRVKDFATPMKHVYTFGTGDDAEEISGRGEFHAQMTGNGDEIAVWFGDNTDDAWIFDNEEDMNANLVVDVVPTSEDDSSVDTYANIEPLTYMQYDGTEVSVPYFDAINMGYGKYNVDYGPLNIGKPANEVADLGEWNFGEWTPKIIDMFAGSAPLFSGKTAWPMAVGNAITSSQGLDPQSYDQSTGSYQRMAEDITADQLALATVLSLGMPATERLAGNLGSAPLSKLTGKAVEKAGLSPLTNYPMEAIVGEGVEEVIAGSWEEVQSMGLDEAFGDPMLDEEGNPMYDSTGHAIKDPSTPIDRRFANYRKTWLENFLGGATLGSVMTAPQVLGDAATGGGYIGQHRAQKNMRDAEKAYGLPRYRVAKKGNKEFVITPEILEQYRREE